MRADEVGDGLDRLGGGDGGERVDLDGEGGRGLNLRDGADQVADGLKVGIVGPDDEGAAGGIGGDRDGAGEAAGVRRAGPPELLDRLLDDLREALGVGGSRQRDDAYPRGLGGHLLLELRREGGQPVGQAGRADNHQRVRRGIHGDSDRWLIRFGRRGILRALPPTEPHGQAECASRRRPSRSESLTGR